MTYPFLQHGLEREKPFMSVCFLFVMALFMFPREVWLLSQQVSDVCLLFLTVAWYALSSTEHKNHA